MKIMPLILFNVVLLTAGQILWKMGLNRIGGFSWDNLVRVLMSPLILAGLALYVVATVVWFAVLTRADLSFAYPLQSSAYVLGVIAAWLIFRENIPLTRWLGVLVIVAGVILVSHGQEKTVPGTSLDDGKADGTVYASEERKPGE